MCLYVRFIMAWGVILGFHWLLQSFLFLEGYREESKCRQASMSSQPDLDKQLPFLNPTDQNHLGCLYSIRLA